MLRDGSSKVRHQLYAVLLSSLLLGLCSQAFLSTAAAAASGSLTTRRLQQATEPPVVSIVETVEDLITGLEEGAAHIEIRAHLDTTGFPLIPALIYEVEFLHLLPPQRSRTRSIRGNCTEPPSESFLNRLSGAPAAAFAPRQCLLLAQSPLLAITEGRALVENLYIRYPSGGGGFGFEEPTTGDTPMLMHIHGGDVYIRDVRLQGDGRAPCRGLIAYPTARVLFEDGAITHMTGDQDDRGQTIVAVAVRSTPTYFLKTAFSDILTAPSSPVIIADGNAPVKIQECTFSASNTAENELRAFAGSTFFTDAVDELTVVGEDDADIAPPEPLSASRGSNFLTEADDWSIDIRELLSGEVRAMPLADALVTPGGIGTEPTDPSGSPLPPGVSLDPDYTYGSWSPGDGDPYGGDDGGLDTWVIIVIIAGIVAVLAVAIGVIIYRRQERRKAAESGPKDQLGYYPQPVAYAPQYAAPYPGYGPGGPPGYVGGPWPHPAAPGPPSESSEALRQKLQAVPGSPGPASSRTQSSAGGGRARVDALPARWHAPYSDADVTFTDDFAMPQYTEMVASPYHTVTEETQTRDSRASPLARRSRQSTRSATYTSATGRGDPGSPVGPVPEGASVPELMDRLSRQLDGMHAIGKPVKERFLPLGEAQRRMGGQGMVQFARDVRDERDYAIKLFVSRKAFDAETALYGDDVLRELLPKIEAMTANEGGEESDAHGTALPPFIIMEKGEALDEWSRRAKPDMFQSVAMLANISRRLAGMHEVGYVHRDLKPGNVMWLPRENRWTIIDFGCVARAGAEASICYSLRYTAPEVIQALHKKRRTMVPQASLDSWALGVMAFELLTGKAAFQPLVDGTQQILAQLLGEQELPWEGSRAAPETMRKLRSLRSPVMALLERDPARRLSMQNFCESCDDIFGTRTYKPAI